MIRSTVHEVFIIVLMFFPSEKECFMFWDTYCENTGNTMIEYEYDGVVVYLDKKHCA